MMHRPRGVVATAIAALVASGLGEPAAAHQAKRLDEAAGQSLLAGPGTASRPLERSATRLPQGALRAVPAIGPEGGPPPRVREGDPGRAVAFRAAAEPSTGRTPPDAARPTPQNYGEGNLDTIFHFTDAVVQRASVGLYPRRAAGLVAVRFPNGEEGTCTGALIAPSIVVTAGHCVHQGGNGQAGFATELVFFPAYFNGPSSFSGAAADLLVTTDQWANSGQIQRGYDVGLAVLRKPSGSAEEIGRATGWFSFCYENCLQPQWYNTQLGYPANYYNTNRMVEGQHHEVSSGDEYVFGSGMGPGSSGGPHVTNLGNLRATGPDRGEYPERNVVLAVTSWGYANRRLGVQGAATLSGPNNTNGFKAMFNQACARARQLHGASSCDPLS